MGTGRQELEGGLTFVVVQLSYNVMLGGVEVACLED